MLAPINSASNFIDRQPMQQSLVQLHQLVKLSNQAAFYNRLGQCYAEKLSDVFAESDDTHSCHTFALYG
jgi:hypothetical protein